MKTTKVLLLTALLCAPVAAFAGGTQLRNVPTLSEVGLVVLGASLVGSAVFALRRGKR